MSGNTPNLHTGTQSNDIVFHSLFKVTIIYLAIHCDSAGLKKELLRSLEDEVFIYMKGNEEWEKLKSDVNTKALENDKERIQ